MENVLSELIYASDKELLEQKGLEFNYKLLKNVDLGKYGTCDLIHFKKPELYEPFAEIDIISCNRDNISMSSFIDAITNAKGVLKYIEQKYDYVFKFNIHIIAKNIDSKSNIVFLPDILPYSVYFYTYNVNIDGIYFEKISDFELPNEELIKKKKNSFKLKSLQSYGRR